MRACGAWAWGCWPLRQAAPCAAAAQPPAPAPGCHPTAAAGAGAGPLDTHPPHTPPPAQALHLEDNDLTHLPLGPYLPTLRELLLDWATAFDAPAALGAATQLTR